LNVIFKSRFAGGVAGLHGARSRDDGGGTETGDDAFRPEGDDLTVTETKAG